jgi:hypothetical protein
VPNTILAAFPNSVMADLGGLAGVIPQIIPIISAKLVPLADDDLFYYSDFFGTYTGRG